MTLFVFSLLFFAVGNAVHTTKNNNPLPGNETIPAVFVFGDSLVDTGNNNYIKTLARVNFPPYGKDFIGGKPTGRFSNGKVPADLFVEELGIKELLPPYLDPSLKTEDLLTGVNFASGASGYDPRTSKQERVISPSDQLKLFEEYKVKLQGIVGEEGRRRRLLSKSLFMVVFGSNDISNAYFKTPLPKFRYVFSSYCDRLISYASDFLKSLYGTGARRIGVFGAPPIGCIPSERTLAGGVHRKCAEKYNEAAQMFNSKLSAELDSLNANLSDARFVYVDIYNHSLDLIQNPTKYGFKISNKGCCGTGIIEVAFTCSSRWQSCSNVSEYVFWDTFHLTERAYTLLVHQFFTQFLSSFFSRPEEELYKY